VTIQSCSAAHLCTALTARAIYLSKKKADRASERAGRGPSSAIHDTRAPAGALQCSQQTDVSFSDREDAFRPRELSSRGTTYVAGDQGARRACCAPQRGGGEGVLSAGAHHNAPDLANVAERMMPQARCSLHKTDTHTSANKADLSRDTPARPGWAAAGQFPTAGALALGAVGAAAPAACSRCSAPAAQPASPSPGLPHPPFDPEPPSKLSRPMH